jgi:bifunctional DNA-binding transcriptional regulator/antitoxin component of YhaV-PrlF toxin-antitoxin module
MTRIIVRQKGQVTLTKELRERYGITEGSLVEELPTPEGILIKPVEKTIKRWKSLSERISKKWPSDLSAVSAVREERTK